MDGHATVPLELLLPEILLCVADHLPEIDRQCLRQTCTRFRSLLPPPAVLIREITNEHDRLVIVRIWKPEGIDTIADALEVPDQMEFLERLYRDMDNTPKRITKTVCYWCRMIVDWDTMYNGPQETASMGFCKRCGVLTQPSFRLAKEAGVSSF